MRFGGGKHARGDRSAKQALKLESVVSKAELTFDSWARLPRRHTSSSGTLGDDGVESDAEACGDDEGGMRLDLCCILVNSSPSRVSAV